MSVIQRIRDKAAWIIIATIAIALLSFIIQDAFYGKGRMSSSKDAVASVNGEEISHTTFDEKLDFYEKANNGQVQRNQLIGQLWDFMVNNEVMQQEYDKLGLSMGSGELNDVLFGAQPPQWMQQFFTDPKTGVYNVNTAKQQLAQIKQKPNDPQVQSFTEAYIDPTIQQTLNQKYQSLITEAVYVPKWMAEKTNADASSLAKISYVAVPYSTISDSSIKVTDDDLEDYIKKHEKQFERDDETRMISYVSFSALPSNTDSASAKNDLQQGKQDFSAAPDVVSFLNTKNTEIPYYNSYLGAADIQQPVKDSLLKLNTGEIYGPYTDGGNYVLAKMIDKRTIADSATVRHILVATHQQDQQSGSMYRVRDDSAALKRLDSAIAELKNGALFDSVCAKYSDDPGSKDKGGVYNYFSSGKMDAAFNDFAFTGSVGQTKTVSTVYGYHYMEILGQKGQQEGYKIAYLTAPIVASEETDNSASNAAAQFAASARTVTQFQANAKNQKLPVLPSQEFRENDFTVSGLGDSRELVKWAWKADVGDISEPLNIDSKYVVAMLTNIFPKGDATVSSARTVAQPFVINQKKASVIINKKLKGNTLEALSKSAGVPVMNQDSVSFSAFTIPSVGNEMGVIGAAFNKSLNGKISTPIAGTTSVFIIKDNGIYGVASTGANPQTQKETLETQLKQQAGYRSMNVPRKVANVKDYRSSFY